MSMRENSSRKQVTVNMQDGLEDEIKKLTAVMSQLTTEGKSVTRQFKPKIHQGRGRGQSRNFYNNHNYDQWNYQNMYRSNSRDKRNQYRQNRGRPRYEENNRNDYRRETFRGNRRTYQNYGWQSSGNRKNYRNENYDRERGRSRSRERYSHNN